MDYLKYFVLFLGVNLASVTSKHVKFYRKDYTYMVEYDAFYKLHVDNNLSWKTAFLTCENEHARLFYPSEEDEWRIVEKLRKKMETSTNVTDALIGVHNQFNLGEFITIDGRCPPIHLGRDFKHVEVGEACVTMNVELESFEKGPCTRQTPTFFVCKKMDKPVCMTTICPTIDPDYKYSSELKKCYKVSKKAKQWQEAIQTCYLEGGLLAVAEDRSRVNNIRSVLNLNRYTTYFIGIHDLFNDGEYYTVGGKHVGALPQRTDLVPKDSRSKRYSDWRDYDYATTPWDDYYIAHTTEASSSRSIKVPLGCGVLTDQTIAAASCYKEMPFICEMETSKHPNKL